MSYFLNNVDKENNFIEASKSKYFVDKSLLIEQLNELIRGINKFICITRPRRFALLPGRRVRATRAYI